MRRGGEWTDSKCHAAAARLNPKTLHRERTQSLCFRVEALRSSLAV